MEIYLRNVLSRWGPRVAPFTLLVLAACFGLAIDRWLCVSPVIAWAGGVSTLFYVWRLLLRSRNTAAADEMDERGKTLPAERMRVLASCGMLVVMGALAACWHHKCWHSVRSDNVSRLAPIHGLSTVPVFVRGIVKTCVTTRKRLSHPWGGMHELESRFRLDVRKVYCRGTWRAASGRVWVHCPGTPFEVKAGDHVRVAGHLGRYRFPMNPAQRDLRRQFRGTGVLSVLRASVPESIRVERPVEGWNVRWWTANLRKHWDRVLRQRLDEPTYALAAALLLGNRVQLSDQQRDRYLHTGTVHLLAISGLHVGILAGCFVFAVRGRLLPYRTGLIVVILLMCFYAELTDSRAPVLRASILVQLVCLGWLTHRRNHLGNSLALAASLVLMRNPASLFSVGTQLSFLAVAVLMQIGRLSLWSVPQDPLDRLIWRSRPLAARSLILIGRRCRMLVVASVGVWLITSPLIWHHYHLVSPVAVLLNVVLWLPVAAALLSGFALLLLESWLPPIAAAAAAVCQLSLHSLEAIVAHVDSWPGTHFWLIGPGAFALAVFFLCLAAAVSCVTRRVKFVWIVIGGLALVLGTVAQRSKGVQQDELRCTFLAVGHGTCVVLQLPNGAVWLYDAGRMGDPRSGVDMVSRYLWSRGITRVSRFVLSHLDFDHYGLLPGLSRRFPIDRLTSGGSLSADGAQAAALRQELSRSKIPIEIVSRGQWWKITDACQIEVLHPAEDWQSISDNQNSLVLGIQHTGRQMILPGDIEGRALWSLMALANRSVDCAMAPHHGSLNSHPNMFARWCEPTEFVVSGGDISALRYLDQVLRPLGCRCWHTAIHGAIEVTFQNHDYALAAFRPTGPPGYLPSHVAWGSANPERLPELDRFEAARHSGD